LTIRNSNLTLNVLPLNQRQDIPRRVPCTLRVRPGPAFVPPPHLTMLRRDSGAAFGGRMCGRKKLPFAEYSVVKDSAFALRASARQAL
jgi:hypothetical protein